MVIEFNFSSILRAAVDLSENEVENISSASSKLINNLATDNFHNLGCVVVLIFRICFEHTDTLKILLNESLSILIEATLKKVAINS